MWVFLVRFLSMQCQTFCKRLVGLIERLNKENQYFPNSMYDNLDKFIYRIWYFLWHLLSCMLFWVKLAGSFFQSIGLWLSIYMGILWKVAATCIPCASIAGVAAHKLDLGTDQLIRYTLSVWPEGDDAAWLGWDAEGISTAACT